MIFFPLLRQMISQLLPCPFCLILPYFALILPFYSPFLFSFSIPFFIPLSSFSFPFLPFSFTFSPFVLPLFMCSPQMTLADIFYSRGGGYFPIHIYVYRFLWNIINCHLIPTGFKRFICFMPSPFEFAVSTTKVDMGSNAKRILKLTSLMVNAFSNSRFARHIMNTRRIRLVTFMTRTADGRFTCLLSHLHDVYC